MLTAVILLIVALLTTLLNFFTIPILKRIYGKEKNIFALSSSIKIALLLVTGLCCIFAVISVQ